MSVMTSNRLQIAVKRLTCCNILGSGFPSGIKVCFENIVSEILSDYTLKLEDHNRMCVVV